MSVADRIRILEERVLSDDHYRLTSTTFDWRRTDGAWSTQTRQTFDRGDGAALLPFNREARTVLLVRQFRFPAWLEGHRELLIEVPAGVLDGEAPAERIRAEVEEETGYRLEAIEKVFEAFMSPGAVTEKLHFFVARYDRGMRIAAGGGLEAEGEDIEVLELDFDEALAMIADGRIADAKTIMLLQYAALRLFPRAA